MGQTSSSVPYTGPYKCKAQIKMELQAKHSQHNTSQCHQCTQEIELKEGGKLLRCSQCRSVSYCSVSCQRAHWKDPKNPHKRDCGAYLAPNQTPYVDAYLIRYFDEMGCWPITKI